MNVDERTARVREAMEAAYNAYFEDVYKFVLRGGRKQNGGRGHYA